MGAIVLDPRNIRGRYNFMSLETGQIVDGKVVAVLPVTDEIISRVEELGQQQKQPFRVSRMLKYEWRPGKPFESDDSTTTEPAQPEMLPLYNPPHLVQERRVPNYLRKMGRFRNG